MLRIARAVPIQLIILLWFQYSLFSWYSIGYGMLCYKCRCVWLCMCVCLNTMLIRLFACLLALFHSYDTMLCSVSISFSTLSVHSWSIFSLFFHLFVRVCMTVVIFFIYLKINANFACIQIKPVEQLAFFIWKLESGKGHSDL